MPNDEDPCPKCGCFNPQQNHSCDLYLLNDPSIDETGGFEKPTESEYDDQVFKPCPDCKGRRVVEVEQSDEAIEEAAEEELNDIYGEIDVCGYKYNAGHLLREIDPIAFRCFVAEREPVMEDCETCDGTGEVKA